MKARQGSQDMRIASLLFCPQEPGYPLPKYPSQHWDIPEAQWTSDYRYPGKWSVFFFLEFKSSSEDWNSPVIKLRIMYIASATSMSLKLKPGKSFFFCFIYLFIWGCAESLLLRWELPLVVVSEGYSLVVMRGLLTVAVYRYGTQALGHTGFSRYRKHMGLVDPSHVGSS